MKPNKALSIIWSIFFFVGAIFVAIAIIFNNYNSKKEKIEVTGIISRIGDYNYHHYDNDDDETPDVYVEYVVDGETREAKLNYYSSTMREGDSIDIYYEKGNPSKIGSESGDMLFVYIFGGMGSLFAILGGSGLIVLLVKTRKQKKLKETGEFVQADFVRVELNTTLTVNERHPYRIVCEWFDPYNNIKKELKSENIFTDPQPIITSLGITKFNVYIDPKNTKNYYMDISELGIK